MALQETLSLHPRDGQTELFPSGASSLSQVPPGISMTQAYGLLMESLLKPHASWAQPLLRL